jgi:hypothetical protein
MAATGTPIAYRPHPEHGHGTAALPGLIYSTDAKDRAAIVVFIPNRPDPVHFEDVPRDEGGKPHSWTLPA